MPRFGDVLERIKAIVGTLADAASTTVNTTTTAMSYIKGILNQLARLLAVTPEITRVSVTFVTATTGALGNHTLLTRTGVVFVKRLTIRCSLTPVPDVAGAILSLGTPTNNASLINATTAASLTTDKLWSRSTSQAAAVSHNADFPYLANFALVEDLLYAIATQTIGAGGIDVIVEWYPLSTDGNLAAA